MGFLFAVLSFVVAEEVVQLEPVSVGTNHFKCNAIASVTECNANPYCHSLTGNTPHCIDDPCFNGAQPADIASCPNVLSAVQACSVKHVTAAVLAGDCTGGTGTFCGSPDNQGTYDYCFWANLRDGSCPASVCKKEDASGDRCIPTNTAQCTILSTKEECGLVPKCLWVSSSMIGSSGTCITDECFTNGPVTGVDTCVGRNVHEGAGSCKDFKPWLSGAQLNYCVHKNQSNPNVCYFGTPGATWGSSDDYQNTYPTYNTTTNTGTHSGTPTCTGTISTGCAGNGECETIINAKGAFAGLYCTDGSHGNAGANILYIPTLLLLLTLSFVLGL